jgi:phosphoesterase RecJ-like protein
VPFDHAIAEALFVGIASDTGWFRFSNTRPQTHRLAARLLEFGIDHADLHMRLEQAERPEKLGLMTRALDSLQLVAGGKAAVMTLRQRDFAETGARYEETERLVDLPQVVQSVHVVALITETAEGTIRVSFRSKPDDEPIDVNELARQFGGGGHARAAAAKTALKLPEGRDRVVKAIEKAFAK